MVKMQTTMVVLLMAVLGVVQLTLAQEPPRDRGEPFTAASLDPSVFLDALDKVKAQLFQEVTSRAETLAEASGLGDILLESQQAQDNAALIAEQVKTDLADFIENSPFVEKLEELSDQMMDSAEQFTDALSGVCDAEGNQARRALQLSDLIDVNILNLEYWYGVVDIVHCAVKKVQLNDPDLDCSTVERTNRILQNTLETNATTTNVTDSPTESPTSTPTESPTSAPTAAPTGSPTASPTTEADGACVQEKERLGNLYGNDIVTGTFSVGFSVDGELSLFGAPISGEAGFSGDIEVGGGGAFFGFGGSLTFGRVSCAPAGKYCVQGGDPQPCPAGFYCPQGTSGNPAIHPIKRDLLCEKGYFCPEGSTTSKGRPYVTASGCNVGSTCKCNELGAYCPEGSKTIRGRPREDDVLNGEILCTANTDCTCPTGYYCNGNGDRTACPARYACPNEAMSSTGAAQPCDPGYFCPASSTSSKGEPREPSEGCAEVNGYKTGECICAASKYCPIGSEDQYGAGKCDPGYWCPAGSKTKQGNPLTNSIFDEFTCVANQPCKCESGYYCPQGSLSPKGHQVSPQVDPSSQPHFCEEGFFCPKTSRTGEGSPADAGNHACDGPASTCRCSNGFFCPVGSSDKQGHPRKNSEEPKPCTSGEPCPCPPGFLCNNGEMTLCTPGHYCVGNAELLCGLGSYCPEGSTTPNGNPVSKSCAGNPQAVEVNNDENQCKCAPGHFCPVGSTTPEGAPLTDATELIENIDTTTCEHGKTCFCRSGFWCAEGSENSAGVTRQNSNPAQCLEGYFCPGGSRTEKGISVKGLEFKDPEDEDITFKCTENVECGCPQGFYCRTGTAFPVACHAGYYCSGPRMPNLDENALCADGYYCPTRSTSSEGQPFKGVEGCGKLQPCPCSQGHWCPSGSTRSTGHPVVEVDTTERVAGLDLVVRCTQTCSCHEGFFCPAKSTSPFGKPILPNCAEMGCDNGANAESCGICKCPAGHYCLAGQAPLNDNERLCKEPNYCPATSTGDAGRPIVPYKAQDNSVLCENGQPCVCAPGFVCPDGSQSEKGSPLDDLEAVKARPSCNAGTECPCGAGFYCQNGVRSKCPTGYYCDNDTTSEADSTRKKCGAGFWCPEGSKSSSGEPVERVQEENVGTCEAGTPCSCQAGYWCPVGSRGEKGNPIVAQGASLPQGCVAGQVQGESICPCEKGFYCPKESKEASHANRQCRENFFCPATSTVPEGKPDIVCGNELCQCSGVDKKGTCPCGEGFRCPPRSTTREGQPYLLSLECPDDQPCPCRPGFYCEAGIGERPCITGAYCPGGGSAPLECNEPGYFCPVQSTSPQGFPTASDPTCESLNQNGQIISGRGACLCEAGSYCPERSTTKFGQVRGIDNRIGDPLFCKAGYFCPKGSAANDGRPVDPQQDDKCTKDEACVCCEGFYCPEGSSTAFSEPCDQGYFCPFGSTTRFGQQAPEFNKHAACRNDRTCPCEAGYFCPQGSGPDGTCTFGKCECAESFYCPPSSTRSQGFPLLGDECKVDGISRSCECTLDDQGNSLCVGLRNTIPDGSQQAVEPPRASLRCPIPDAVRRLLPGRPDRVPTKPKKVKVPNVQTGFSLTSDPIAEVQLVREASRMAVREAMIHSAIGSVARRTPGRRHARMLVRERTVVWHERPLAAPRPPVLHVSPADREDLYIMNLTQPESTYSSLNHTKRSQERQLHAVPNSETDASKARGMAEVQQRSRLRRFLSFLGDKATLGFSLNFYFGSDRLQGSNLGYGGWSIGVGAAENFLGLTLNFDANGPACANADGTLDAYSPDQFFTGTPLSLSVNFDLGLIIKNSIDRASLLRVLQQQVLNFVSSLRFPGFSFGAGLGFHTKLHGCSPFVNDVFAPQCADFDRRRRLRTTHNQKFSNSRKLQQGVSQAFDDLRDFVLPVLEKGPITKPFCFGDCSTSNLARNIQGDLLVGANSECNGVQIVGRSDLISFGGIVSTIVLAIPGTDIGDVDLVETILGPLGELGVADASIVIAAAPSPLNLTIQIQGSPNLPSAASLEGFALTFYELFERAVESTTLTVRGMVFSRTFAEFEIRGNLDPTGDEYANVALRSPQGQGPGIFSRTVFQSGQVTQQYGMNMVLQLCMENCDGPGPDKSIIHLGGELAVTLPAPTMGATLTLQSPWRNMFGLKFAHMDNAVVGCSFGPTTFPFPSSMIFGASICISSEAECLDGQANPNEPPLQAKGYVSVDANVPANNYFVTLMRGFTLGNILRVFGNVDSLFEDIRQKLPSALLDTGFTPFKDIGECIELENEDIESGAATIDPQCWVTVAFAPFGAVPDVIPQTEAVEMSLEQGLALSGRANLFNLVQVGLDMQFFIAPGQVEFKVDAELSEINMGGFLQIGKVIVNERASGGMRLFVLASTSQGAFQQDIQAAVSIPIIKSYGEVDILLNNDGASFDGEISLFGGVLKPQVYVAWKWDFSMFEMELENINFVVVEVNNLRAAASIVPGMTEIYFAADISVLQFLGVGGDFYLQEFNGGEDILVRFSLSANVVAGVTTVSGSAVIDKSDITKTEFGGFDIDFTPAGFIEDIGEFAVEVYNDVKDGMVAAWDFAGNLMDSAVGGILNFGEDALRFIDNAFGGFVDGLRNLGGLLSSGFDSFANAFSNVFSQERFTNTVLGVFGGWLLESDTSAPYGSGQRDQWDCETQYVDVTVKTTSKICLFGKCIPSFDLYTERRGPYPNESCIAQKKSILATVETQITYTGNVNNARTESQNKNAGIGRFNGNIPTSSKPSIASSLFKMTVSASGQGAYTVRGETSRLSNTDPTGFEPSKTSFQRGVTLDFSSEEALQSTLDSAVTSLGSLTSQIGLQTQPLVEGSLADYVGVLEKTKPKLSIASTRTVSCEEEEEALQVLPTIVEFDLSCAKTTGDPNQDFRIIPRSSSKRFSENPNHVCGTYIQTTTWFVVDECGQESEDVTQVLTVLNKDPTFLSVPSDFDISTEDDVFDFSTFGRAEGRAFCSNTALVDFEDKALEQVEDGDGCGSWVLRREWHVVNTFSTPTCSSKRILHTQRFLIEDHSPPEFVTPVPATVRIPFFVNFDFVSAPPVISDTPGNAFFAGQGLSNGLSLTSLDSVPTFASDDPTVESQCREEGLARFTRVWTARDACGNTRTLQQEIVVEHPAVALRSTQALRAFNFDKALGVAQRADSCAPGKDLRLGSMSLKANNDWTSDFHDCQPGAWQSDGCRVLSQPSTPALELLAVKPAFIDSAFPPDVTILTNQSVLPKDTGIPEGRAFCGTPFEILNIDAKPVQQSCGVWTIERSWYIRPVYNDCSGGVPLRDDRLVSVRVQVITILDVFPPEFISVPGDAVVEFLEDYGPGSAQVGFPQVEDIAEHPTLKPYNLFFSYPTHLTFEDSVEFPPTPEESCETGLAVVTRVWTAQDACSHQSTWTQKVTIQRGTPMFDTLTSTQLVNAAGSVTLKRSSIAQDAASAGDSFGMWESTIGGGSCWTNGLEYSLVTEQCPKSLVHSTLQTRSLQYGNEKKKNKCNSVSNAEDLLADPRGKVVSSKGLGKTFAASAAVMETVSDKLDSRLSDVLLTGPKEIECASPLQSSCTILTNTIPPKYEEAVSINGDLVLQGHQQVYNLFTVPLHEFFYPTSSQAPLKLKVQAPGFVLVNVVDHVSISEHTNTSYVAVNRAFSEAGPFACAWESVSSTSMPVFGNYDDISFAFATREVEVDPKSQSPSTHLLVNLVTRVDVSDSVENPKEVAAACSGLRFRFSKVRTTSTLYGSWLLTNRQSSWQMWDYEWTGGQLASVHADVELRETTMQCGIFLPNTACPAA